MCCERPLLCLFPISTVISSVMLLVYTVLYFICGPLTLSQDTAYSLFLVAKLVSLVSSIAAGVYIFRYKPEVMEAMLIITGLVLGSTLCLVASMKFVIGPTQSDMIEFFEYHRQTHDGQPPAFLKVVQLSNKCCGMKSYLDYKMDTTNPLLIKPQSIIVEKINLPDTCCKKYVMGCGRGLSLDVTNNLLNKWIYTNGCFQNGTAGLGESSIIYKGIATVPITTVVIDLLLIGVFFYHMRGIIRTTAPDPTAVILYPSGNVLGNLEHVPSGSVQKPQPIFLLDKKSTGPRLNNLSSSMDISKIESVTKKAKDSDHTLGKEEISSSVVPTEAKVKKTDGIPQNKPSGFLHFFVCKWRRLRWGYLVFVLSFALAITLVISLNKLTVGHRFEPTCFEGVQSTRLVKLVAQALLFMSPIGLLFLYFEVPQKHMSMIYFGLLAVCFCFAFCGIINTAVWKSSTRQERIMSMIEYSKGEYFGNKGISRKQRNTETKEHCCGITNFMDYPLQIFVEERIPDHCCINRTKNCGKEIFQNTPFSYARARRHFIVPLPSSCLFNSTVPKVEIEKIVNFDKTLNVTSLDILIREFINHTYDSKYLCDDLSLDNFLNPLCILVGDRTVQVTNHKLRWCFSLFYNGSDDTVRDFGIKLNTKLKLVIPDGCYNHLEKFADLIINWIMINFLLFTFVTFAMLLLFLKYYHDYRDTQLKIYPLPLWLQKFPGETDATIPRGLGRRCHVNHAIAMLSERDVKNYLKKYPLTKKEAKQRLKVQIERQNEGSIAVTPVSLTAEHARPLEDKDVEGVNIPIDTPTDGFDNTVPTTKN